MATDITLKPCPFCGGAASFAISDDEGNDRDEAYESDPWSGLAFRIEHQYELNKECPIAGYRGEPLGVHLYDSREDAAAAWNKRV